MINFKVKYKECSSGELVEKSTWAYSNINGWYDAYFDIDGTYYDWYAKGMNIMGYPGDVILPAESQGVRWIYHYDPIQSWADPDAWWNNPNLRHTNWYVIDTDLNNDWIPSQLNPSVCGEWEDPESPPLYPQDKVMATVMAFRMILKILLHKNLLRYYTDIIMINKMVWKMLIMF